ncbi:hypothetical protein D3C74_390310 [compost metagenome]
MSPTEPPPPVLLSTMTGWPRTFSAALAKARAVVSVPPPAAYGTINVIGFLGKSPLVPPLLLYPVMRAKVKRSTATITAADPIAIFVVRFTGLPSFVNLSTP